MVSGCAVKLFFRWHSCPKRIISPTSSLAHRNQLPLRSYSLIDREERLRTLRQRQYRLFAAVTIAMSAFFALVYQLPFVISSTREGNHTLSKEDGNLALRIGVSFSLSLSIVAGGFFIMAWYYSLPDVHRFGNLLQLDSILLKVHSLFARMCFSWSLIALSVAVITLILPSITDRGPDSQARDVVFAMDILLVLTVWLLQVFLLIGFIRVSKNVRHVLQQSVDFVSRSVVENSRNESFKVNSFVLGNKDLALLKVIISTPSISYYFCIESSAAWKANGHSSHGYNLFVLNVFRFDSRISLQVSLHHLQHWSNLCIHWSWLLRIAYDNCNGISYSSF